MAVDQNILNGVKARLSETGSFEETDAVLTGYIEDVMDFMRGAGVSEQKIAASVGTIARGVDDMWTNNSGAAEFSPMFQKLVTQLAMRSL